MCRPCCRPASWCAPRPEAEREKGGREGGKEGGKEGARKGFSEAHEVRKGRQETQRHGPGQEAEETQRHGPGQGGVPAVLIVTPGPQDPMQAQGELANRNRLCLGSCTRSRSRSPGPSQGQCDQEAIGMDQGDVREAGSRQQQQQQQLGEAANKLYVIRTDT